MQRVKVGAGLRSEDRREERRERQTAGTQDGVAVETVGTTFKMRLQRVV